MIQLFSPNGKKFLSSLSKSETDLNKFLSDNWEILFPQYLFIKSEFVLDGMVRSKTAAPGRIDILAFNPRTYRFVVFELKRAIDKNILSQASDYKDFIEENFSDVYLTAKDHNSQLPNHRQIAKDTVEVVLMAKEFNELNINKAQKSETITLIKYIWLEGDLLLTQYINNYPSELFKREKIPYVEQPAPERSPIHSARDSKTKVTLKSDRKGVLAFGERLEGNKILVLAGSKVSDNPEPGFAKNAPTAFKIRNEYQNDGTINQHGKFTRDKILSKSTAESVIKGGSRDGSGWK